MATDAASPMRGLYVVVDLGSLARRKLDVVAFTRAVLRARPAMVQLRAKGASVAEAVGWLGLLAPLCRAAEVPLVANDSAEVALGGGTDWLHLGQSDPPATRVRSEAPTLSIGISTHSPQQLRDALAQRPAYVAYGPVFATLSKVNADPTVGLEGLAAASEIVASLGGTIPLVAIGGLTLERAQLVRPWVSMGAVIGDLLPPAQLPAAHAYDWVTDRAKALHAEFSRSTTSSSGQR